MSVICFQCGIEIEEGTGIRHRSRLFCSDECCNQFEEEFAAAGEPGVAELETEELLAGDLDLSEIDLDGDFETENDDLDLPPDELPDEH